MILKQLLTCSAILLAATTAQADGKFPFTEQKWIKGSGQPKSVQLVDLDGDKDLDVLVIEAMRGGYHLTTIKWYQNKKNGKKFVERIIDSSLMLGTATVGDIDGDGDLDILATGDSRNDTEYRGGVLWYENVGKAKAWTPHVVHRTGDSGVPRLGDLDGDGDLDIVIGSRKIVTYQNKGKGKSWSSARTIAGKAKVRKNAFLLLDYDGDKDLDVVARVNDTFTWFENATGAWKPHLITNTKKQVPVSLQAIDFDKDGDLDLVVGARRSVAVYINYGKGKFGAEEVVESGYIIKDFQALAADVNRDGKLDVIVNYPRKMVWFEVDDDDDWKAHPIATLHHNSNYFLVGDIDKDGDPDLLRNKDTKFALLWWENTASAKASK